MGVDAVRLRVRDPDGVERSWPVENFDVHHIKESRAFFFGAQTPVKHELLITVDLDSPIDPVKEPAPPDSLAAADEYAARVIKHGSKDELHVLYCRLFEGLGIRYDAAKAVVDRLKRKKA